MSVRDREVVALSMAMAELRQSVVDLVSERDKLRTDLATATACAEQAEARSAELLREEMARFERLRHDWMTRVEDAENSRDTLAAALQTARLALEAVVLHRHNPCGKFESSRYLCTCGCDEAQKALATITAIEGQPTPQEPCPEPTPRLDTFERGEKRGFG